MLKLLPARAGYLVVVLGLVLGVLGLPHPSSAAVHIANLPPNFVGEPVITGKFIFDQPTAVTWAADGRMFIAQKEGTVKVWQNGVILPDYFIDLKTEVSNSSDRGLLAIELDPQFLGSRPYMYLYYVHDPVGVTPDPNEGARVSRLVRITADVNQNRNVGIPGSELILLGKNSTVDRIGNPTSYTDNAHPSCQVGGLTGDYVADCIPSDSNTHAGAGLKFAPDGSLFVSIGDGGGFGGVDPRALRSQSLESLAGKLLRVDPDTGNGLPSNPFYNGDLSSTRSKIYSYGMRNPFRFALKIDTSDASEPYKPYVGDVGDGTWEEINTGRGANFGWPCYEGGNGESLEQPFYQSDPSTTVQCNALNKNAVKPSAYGYLHYVPIGAGAGTIPQGSVQAGAFFSGTAYPAEYQNALFITDYVHDWVRYLKLDALGNVTGVFTFATDISPKGGPVQLSQGPDGNLYYLAYDWDGDSGVYRIRYTAGGNNPPTARAQADKVYGALPLAVNFTGSGSTDPEGQALSYLWDFGDGTTSTASNPAKIYTVAGTYTATLTVRDPQNASSTASIRIDPGNTPPAVTLNTPISNTLFKIGDVVNYAGSATDTEDGGAVPTGRLQWKAFLFHGSHVHPNTVNSVGASGSFTISQHDDNSYYKLCLEATDSKGLKGSQCVDILLRTVRFSFYTDPPGLQVAYGVESPRLYNTPVTLDTIVGSVASISAPEPQLGFNFTSWSTGTPRFFTTTVTTTERSFTATFTAPPPVAVITATPTSGPGPLKVQFDGSGSTVGGVTGAIQTFLWEFGDGLTSTLAAPLHVYAVPGSYTARLVVTNLSGLPGETTRAITVNDPVPNVDLPKPYVYDYVGTGTTLSAASSYINGELIACSSGIDLYGLNDEIGFIHRAMSGDGEIIARMLSLDAVPDYGAKAGLMIRESIASDAKYFDQLQTNAFGHRVEVRAQTALTETQIGFVGGFGMPTWMRLTRINNLFAAYRSDDGITWQPIDNGSATVSMNKDVLAGFVVTSVDPTRRTCARFDNLRFRDANSNFTIYLPVANR